MAYKREEKVAGFTICFLVIKTNMNIKIRYLVETDEISDFLVEFIFYPQRGKLSKTDFYFLSAPGTTPTSTLSMVRGESAGIGCSAI